MRFVIVDNVFSETRGIIYRADNSQSGGKGNISLLGTSGIGKGLNNSSGVDDEEIESGCCCKKKKKKEPKQSSKQPLLEGLKDNQL